MARTFLSAGIFGKRFRTWQSRTIKIEPFEGGNDDYGEPIYGPSLSFQCAIDEQAGRVRDDQGEEHPTRATIYVAGGPFMTQDKLTMPEDGYVGPRNPQIIVVRNLWDFRIGTFDHSEIFI